MAASHVNSNFNPTVAFLPTPRRVQRFEKLETLGLERKIWTSLIVEFDKEVFRGDKKNILTRYLEDLGLRGISLLEL